ncbi:winged helix-turn-helix transcriptional regulator [Sneathiella sp. CAU 1612]|uniref:Winged helix-turn-helix transcriptional regulator n=1 Tax=Sneathiella sedimenti TaxID=2816034 RepID=A0ABS3F779_9PROT|nr:metalloregulator ArsR/SmtB family transcription factor [Sneathiella sedimenti]MBO0334348.1 winged helix-turn-helix transcriptional regulator [Sneathiella sedimenti]
MNIKNMKASAARASNLMKALSSETRLLLLCRMSEGEASVTELAEMLAMRPSSVSQQLSLLRKDGLVKTRREGQTIFYSLHGEEAQQVISVLYALYCK